MEGPGPFRVPRVVRVSVGMMLHFQPRDRVATSSWEGDAWREAKKGFLGESATNNIHFKRQLIDKCLNHLDLIKQISKRNSSKSYVVDMLAPFQLATYGCCPPAPVVLKVWSLDQQHQPPREHVRN